MEVDNCFENHLRLCPRSLVMDEHGSTRPRSSAGVRVSTKSRAPSPPGLKKLDSPGLSQWYPGPPHLTMDQKENLIDKDLSLVVVLPDGVEKMTTVHGSKPLMDLLVTLCAKYHLNPSSYTLELVTASRHNVKLKPNALIGTLDAEKIILKPKGEDKNKKTGPQMPEATVRMVINYKKTQKTILRVNPRVPLAELLPAICEKCEFDAETTVLLRDVLSPAPLDLSSSLNDYAIREVYARDTRGPASPVCPSSPAHTGAVTPGKDKDQKEKENKGLFSKFRKSKKTSTQATTASAPASPVLVTKPRPLSMALPSSNASSLGSPTFPADGPKKRRAPQPPLLVSQSCSADLGPRRRLCSEPGGESEQMSRLSRGSSAESSLKRIKRKAPPPPTSPGLAAAAATAAVPDTLPTDENAQGGAPPTPLEEIMEQEETAPSVMSASAGEAAGDDSSLSLSAADVSPHSPSPEPGRLSAMSVDGLGEDHAHDLSSDGKYELYRPRSDDAVVDVRTTGGEVVSELEDGGPCQAVDGSHQPPCEGSTTVSVKGDGGAVPSGPPPSPPQPATQDAEVPASAPANTESLGEQTVSSGGPAAPEASRPAGEDVQVQTDLTELPDLPPPPPPPPPPQEPPTTNPPGCESTTKRDMATLTEELDPADLRPASLRPPETSPPPPPCPQATPKAASVYAADSEPKPKPSNELTRDYIPKVGMTTYTIVPQKSLDKLRYYEVELTLEAPAAATTATAATAAPEGLDIGSLQLEEQTEVSPEQHSHAATQGPTHTTATHSTVNGLPPEPTRPPSPPTSPRAEEEDAASASSQAGSPAEVKEVKIPPATKPKPGSFRLAKHKKTPGYYVTSAAEKSPGASPDHERVKLPLPPPPPPPPPAALCRDDPTGAAGGERSPSQVEEGGAASKRLSRQQSSPSSGLSLEKLRSFAAPKPYSPSTPSRFAQAVSSAVKRSQSLSQEAKSPRSPPFSPVTSPYAAMHSPGVFKFKDNESREVAGDSGSALPGVEGGTPSLSEVADMPGGSSP